MAYISQITLPSGTTYDIKDAWARTQIEAITGGSAIVFKGVTTTALTDGGNENPTVSGSQVTTKATGDLYFYNKEQFIYGDDNKWHSLGPQLQTLGALAYKDNASGSYTPAGTISGGVVTMTTPGATTNINNPTSETVAKTVVAVAPGGSAPSNNLTYYNVTGENLSLYQLGYTTGDSITTSSVTVKTGDAEYESEAPTFTGTAATITVS